MDLREVKSKQGPYQDNQFARISEDLLLFILTKIDDLKYLCRCSLVSKYFKSTIYLIKNVSVTIPSSETPSAEPASEIEAITSKITSLTVEETNRCILSSSLKWLNFLLFLQNFRQLKSISLKFTCPAEVCSSSFYNLKIRCSDSGTLVERLISLIPVRVYRLNEHENLVNDYGPHDRVTLCETQVNSGCHSKWLLVMFLLLKCQPSLESVVITDSNKPWTLVLKDKQLVALRNNMFRGGSILGNMAPMGKECGLMSDLRLQVSGYALKVVKYMIEDMEFSPHSDSTLECATCRKEGPESLSDDAMIWEFVGDKRIFNETWHEMRLEIDQDDD